MLCAEAIEGSSLRRAQRARGSRVGAPGKFFWVTPIFLFRNAHFRRKAWKTLIAVARQNARMDLGKTLTITNFRPRIVIKNVLDISLVKLLFIIKFGRNCIFRSHAIISFDQLPNVLSPQ